MVLRCFNSHGSITALANGVYVNTGFLFGNPGIIGRVRLPRAYRSLPRPSSLLKPSNPPTGVYALV